MARNKYPEVTVERILDVSQRLFLEKGYENTTIQDIVDELGGLTKGRSTTTSSPRRRSWTRWGRQDVLLQQPLRGGAGPHRFKWPAEAAGGGPAQPVGQGSGCA